MTAAQALIDPLARPARNRAQTSGHTPGGAALASGLEALCLLARLHQTAADPRSLRHQWGMSPSEPVALNDLLLAAKHLSLKARHHQATIDGLARMPLPALVIMRDGSVAVLA